MSTNPVKGEGAWAGEWMCMSSPIMNGAAILCTMDTRRWVLTVKCLPHKRNEMIVKMLKEAGAK